MSGRGADSGRKMCSGDEPSPPRPAPALSFLDFKNLSIPQQICKLWHGHSFRDSKYPQYLSGDSEFQGIFSGGPPSHSVFLKINGINLHSTFPGEIQVSGKHDTSDE